MKKNLILLVLVLFAVTACKQKPQYEIKGTIADELPDSTYVYLKANGKQVRTAPAIDSTVAVNNTFTFTGSVEIPDVYYLFINNRATIVFLENAPIEVTIDPEDPDNSKATGSTLNDLYNSYLESIDKFKSKLQALENRFREAMDASPDGKISPEFEEEVSMEYQEIMEEQKAYQIQFLNENPNNAVAACILQQISYYLTTEELDEQLNKFDAANSQLYSVIMLREYVETQKKTAVGQPFVDIKLSDTEGNPIALSDYAGKGKYVLVDFWASWCGPCRGENPNVVALYDRYKDKGFEIVGVSLDQDKDAWLKGIKDDGITWPQMSDLKYWDSEGAKLYSVRSIPATVLIDKDGIIIARDLRGEELDNKVAELIDEK